MRIFIYDDDPETLESLVTYLTCETNKLYYFVNPKEAMKFARQTNNDIDVAVIDGGFDSNEAGVKISIILRNNNPDARIIILTGFSELSAMSILEEYNVELYEKPQDVPKIIDEFGCI